MKVLCLCKVKIASEDNFYTFGRIIALKMQLSENNIDASFSHVTALLATHNALSLSMCFIPWTSSLLLASLPGPWPEHSTLRAT